MAIWIFILGHHIIVLFCLRIITLSLPATKHKIKAITRAADELIATGGRTILTRILKGSRNEKVLGYGLDQCPVYGFYQQLPLNEINCRIDYLILNDYLEIVYRSRLPVIVFTAKGWEIEKETYAEELLQKLTALLKDKDFGYVSDLKDRNWGMILLLIEKIRKTKNPDFIPLHKVWQEIDYNKVRTALQKVINELMKYDVHQTYNNYPR